MIDIYENLQLSSCIIHTGSFTPRGYPRIWLPAQNKFVSATRYIYEKHHGVKLTNDDIIIHLCRNRRCTNAEHLVRIKKDQ